MLYAYIYDIFKRICRTNNNKKKKTQKTFELKNVQIQSASLL